jgi:thioredoxin-like negative regulator of GroEL
MNMRRSLLSLLMLASALASCPVRAETPEQLDQIVDAMPDAASGLALANQQAARGDVLEAIATLERLLARDPKAQDARLAHAVMLCRIDDRPGGAVALTKLKKKKHSKADWAAALSACGMPQDR